MTILKTPFYEFHKKFGGKLVDYANYYLPISYQSQTHIESHNYVRNNSGLFDVSHMLQHKLVGKQCSEFLESLTPTNIKDIPVGSCHLSTFLNEHGGIVDDTIITKVSENELYVVSNGATSDKISKYISENLNNFQGGNHDLKYTNFKKALVAIQGPKTHEYLSKFLNTDLKDVYFGNHFFFNGKNKIIGKGFIDNFNDKSDGILVSRSGYTGEDGFEISIPNPEYALEFVNKLIDGSEIKPIGLAARDSLRLEAGMCLYGNELTESITPIEASLNWIISKNRRTPKTATFKGSSKILEQLADKSKIPYKRVGFQFEGGAAARHGSKIFVKESDELKEVGFVTSGSQSPTLSLSGSKVNIGQGYVQMPFNKKETDIIIQIRKKFVDAKVKKLPLVESHYYKP